MPKRNIRLAALSTLAFGAVLIIELTGCNTSPAVTDAVTTDPNIALYAVSAGLDQAEVAVLAYEQSPMANAAVVAKLKTLDATAYGAVHPLLDQVAAGSSVASIVEASAAQKALTDLTDFMTANGVT